MRILLYYGKHDNQCWLADTVEHTRRAQLELFNQLDDEGCYEEDTPLLDRARSGDARAINAILTERRTCEYESWSYEEVKVL